MGLPQQSFGAGLEHGPAALFDLCLPASQLGKGIIHLLLHCGLGAPGTGWRSPRGAPSSRSPHQH